MAAARHNIDNRKIFFREEKVYLVIKTGQEGGRGREWEKDGGKGKDWSEVKGISHWV